jgi:hypothetical protein
MPGALAAGRFPKGSPGQVNIVCHYRSNGGSVRIMTDSQGSSPTAKRGGDQGALDVVTTRLAAAFPDVPPAALEESVRREYHRFDKSRVRAFVPLLVEHAVRDEFLAAPSQ